MPSYSPLTVKGLDMKTVLYYILWVVVMVSLSIIALCAPAKAATDCRRSQVERKFRSSGTRGIMPLVGWGSKGT